MVEAVSEKRLTQVEAARQLGVTRRQAKRLVADYRREGAAGLVSRRQGKPSNRRLKDALQDRLRALLVEQYPDFGPTLAREKLLEVHALDVSIETVRQLQMALGLWKPKTRKAARLFQARERRARFGELIQIDGSPHDWFEGRSPFCTLIVFIDDATGRLTQLYFAPSETTAAYREVLRRHLALYGRPVALYSDRHSIFRINREDPANGQTQTQFGRALAGLEIEAIHAHTPQAKGRVERVNQTLQDRLVKELRLRGLSDIDSANTFLPEFIADYDRRFAVTPISSADAHRPVVHSARTLDLLLCEHSARTLSKNLTPQYRTPSTNFSIGEPATLCAVLRSPSAKATTARSSCSMPARNCPTPPTRGARPWRRPRMRRPSMRASMRPWCARPPSLARIIPGEPRAIAAAQAAERTP